MTPSWLALVVSTVAASPTASSTAAESLELQRFRMPYESVIERTIGVASKPVRYDWRRSDFQLAAFVAQPAEFNNYNTVRAGALVRIPSDSLMIELGLSYAWVFGTEASRQLALTPYRQPGRPPRIEIDVTVGLPLAEGVVTAWPSWFPAFELVFSAYVNFRYLLYPTGFKGSGAGDALLGLLGPGLRDAEIESLESSRLPGMEIDPQRYYILAGLGTELYFKSGFFLAPRILLNIPILAAATGSKMTYGVDFSLAVGLAF